MSGETFRPDRRRFLKRGALLTGAATLCPAWAWAQPGVPATPIRIRGRVRADGRGLGGVAVTDGLSIVSTDRSGDFELISTTRRAFVYLTVPAGYSIPRNETGTARFYRPIMPDARGEMRTVFDLAARPVPDATHAFVVLADPQTQDAFEMNRLHQETVPDVQATVAGFGDVPSFGVACGDIMFDELAFYPDYERAVSRMGIPFFQVIGNHDLDFGPTDAGSDETFCRHFGPGNYTFDRGAVHYVVLDDVFWKGRGYLGYLSDDQLTWLRADLARVEAGRTVVVFLHIPAHSTQDGRASGSTPGDGISVTNREALYELLAPYRAHLIAGHTHESEHVFVGGVHEHILGAACGAWWSGDICSDGTPNGYGVFEVVGEDIRWRYKGTGHPLDHQLRTYPRGTDLRAPDEIVANIWDWDPAWTVSWYENGMRKGLMARRRGTDPLSESLHRGSDKPSHRPWVEPVPTDHLFYAPVSPGARDVRVEAVDRFGRTYSAAVDPA